MIIWTVENEELVKYERTGVCNMCGDCCRNWTITFESAICRPAKKGEPDPDYSDCEGFHYLFHHGVWWQFNIISAEPDEGYSCTSLYPQNICKDWQDPVRFKPICRYWPFHPSNLEHYPNCSFKFERQEEVIVHRQSEPQEGQP